MIFLTRKSLLLPLSAMAVVMIVAGTDVSAQEAVKPCKSARFKSPFDLTIDVIAYVKAGDRCTIRLSMGDVAKTAMVRNARLGKTEQVPDSADMTFSYTDKVSGLDQVVYDVERTENDKPVKQRIRVEISVLKAADYPAQVAFKDEPLPESSFSQAASANNASEPSKKPVK